MSKKKPTPKKQKRSKLVSPPSIWISREASELISKYYGIKFKPGWLYQKKVKK